MVGALSFSQPFTTLLHNPYNLYKNVSSANSHFPIPPLVVHRIILTITTNTPFFYILALFHLPFFAYIDPYNLHEKVFSSAIWPIQTVSRDQ